MAFMVRNPNLVPAFSTIRSGAIQRRRREMREIIDSCWKSCFESDYGHPFVADAIIANPPSLAISIVYNDLAFLSTLCLRGFVPITSKVMQMNGQLIYSYGMPWPPTQSFPRPLSITHPEHCKETTANFISYASVDMMV